MALGFGFRVEGGMFSLILAVLYRDYSSPPILIPIKDCEYIPKV